MFFLIGSVSIQNTLDGERFNISNMVYFVLGVAVAVNKANCVFDERSDLNSTSLPYHCLNGDDVDCVCDVPL